MARLKPNIPTRQQLYCLQTIMEHSFLKKETKHEMHTSNSSYSDNIISSYFTQKNRTRTEPNSWAGLPELPDGEDAAAASGRRPDSEERAVGQAAPRRRRHEHIAAHVREDPPAQRDQAPVLDRDPGAHRHPLLYSSPRDLRTRDPPLAGSIKLE